MSASKKAPTSPRRARTDGSVVEPQPLPKMVSRASSTTAFTSTRVLSFFQARQRAGRAAASSVVRGDTREARRQLARARWLCGVSAAYSCGTNRHWLGGGRLTSPPWTASSARLRRNASAMAMCLACNGRDGWMDGWMEWMEGMMDDGWHWAVGNLLEVNGGVRSCSRGVLLWSLRNYEEVCWIVR